MLDAWLAQHPVIRTIAAVVVPLLCLAVFSLVCALVLMAWEAIVHPPRKRAIRGSPSDAARIRSRMKRLARTTLLLVPARVTGFSKLGGQPELPEGVDWPVGVKHPRAFLAQVDLSGLPFANESPWLPGSGRLYAFLDDQRYGCSDEVILVHSTEPAGEPRPFPDALPEKQRFGERRVAFERHTSTPSLDWLEEDTSELDLSDQESEQLGEAHDATFGNEAQHRIGGYPGEIQSEQMAISCELMRRGLVRDWSQPVAPAIRTASRQWRLILQIDSDLALGMNWGDGGRFYVFGRAGDLAKGDFSRTVTITQTY